MKKLIAKRRILYLGQMYEAGDTLPVNDAGMARAWLRAGSAEWRGQEAAERRQTPPKTEQGDGDTPEPVAAQNGPTAPENKETDGAPEQTGGQPGTTPPESGESGGTPEMVDGHQPAASGTAAGTTAGNMAAVDPEQLATMRKDALEKLAAQLGVDISKAKNNQERAALIAAVTVQAPVEETGGAQ